MSTQLILHPGEARTYAFDFSTEPELSTLSLSGTPTVTLLHPAAGLTLGTPTISGKTVTALITAGTTNGVQYELKCSCGLSDGTTTLAVPGEVLVWDGF